LIMIMITATFYNDQSVTLMWTNGRWYIMVRKVSTSSTICVDIGQPLEVEELVL